MDLNPVDDIAEISEENFFSGKLAKECRIRGLNSVDYNLNSPLVADDLTYLLDKFKGRPVPIRWKMKKWDSILDQLRKHDVDYLRPSQLHQWFAEWMLHSKHPSKQGEEFLRTVDSEASETFEVVKSFVRGWTGGEVNFIKKSGKHMGYCADLCQKFLDLHKLTLLVNAATDQELLQLSKTFGDPKIYKKRLIRLPSLGRVIFDSGFFIVMDQRVLMDRNFMLMMKDVVIGRMQTVLSMISRCDDKFGPGDIDFLKNVYSVGDRIIKKLGNDGYELIKTVEPMCNLRLSDLARKFRPMIPAFPHFRRHIETTVNELTTKTTLIKELFSLIDNSPNVDSTLVVYGSFRHWGHPFINYFEGLEKLHKQVTMEKEIDVAYSEALASDLARIVLTKEFNEKKQWAVDYHRVPSNHPFKNHIRDNTWPTAAVIQDFGDHWHELPLIQCFDIPDLIDPSIIYSDKSHSMNRSEVLNHVRTKPHAPIPSKKVLESMIDKPATNWLEFLDEIDKNGLSDEDLVIGLKGKERELKIAGRFFSLMSWKLREYFVVTEYLIKTHFVPLFHGLTMADDMTAVIKKMLESSSGQGLTNYESVCIANHIDYEKWNNHQRKLSNGPVFRVMGQFLGYPNLIYRTHEFFEKSLIYYNERPDLMKVKNGVLENSTPQRVCWNGQAGGLEGLRQKGWSILNLLVIQREAKIRNTAVKVLAQGDNQVICTQYKTKQFRNDTELRQALKQMAANNDVIMKAIESGTNKLGLLINQDETMQSADYLNYGKVPIFRGVIRGLETKRWSRVTCVTNDQLPTCANLMSSVSTNALTVAHFDVHPLNAMIQFNFFGNFARLLLVMHDPAIRRSLTQLERTTITVDSYGFKIAMLYLDPSIGGVCGTALSRFLIRSFPDPVTESLSFWKVIYQSTSDVRLKNLAEQFGNPKIAIFRESHIEKLLEDPTSLNISMGMSAANLLKTEIKKNLLQRKSNIGNQIVKDAVYYIHSEDEKLRTFLWSITPLFPRFLSEFKAGTFMGVASSIVSLFQNSRTIRNVFRDYMSQTIDELIIKSELTSLEHLSGYKEKHGGGGMWTCSAEQADKLRRLSWKRPVLGTTVPHPLEMHGKGTLKSPLSKCCKESKMDYISVHIPEGLSHVMDSRGSLPAYLGSKTSESTSILQPWEKESKIPIIRRATRLRDAIHWFVDPESNLARSILNNIEALTGEKWEGALKGYKRTGSALHRFSTSRVSHGGFSSQSPACLTRMMATTDTMRDYAQLNYDFMFQASLLYSQMTSSVVLLGTTVSNTIHFHINCKKCIREIAEPMLESPREYMGKDVHLVLEKWKNSSGGWGETLQLLKPVEGDWESIPPVEKSYHVGRILGFLYGDLKSQNSSRADDSSIFPLSIQMRLRGRGFLRGILDGLVRASACQVIHRRSIALLSKPANAIYGGLIYLIDKISSSTSFTTLCRDGPIREELSSIPHKIPTSYPTSNSDMGLHIRNYLKFQCKTVELGKYQSDIKDLWLFSDVMTSNIAGPFALSTKILRCLYKPSLSQKDRNNIRKISNFSKMMRSQMNWDPTSSEFITSQILVCNEEIRHACKFGIPKLSLKFDEPVWGPEDYGLIWSIPVDFSSQPVDKALKPCPRIQNPSISGFRLGQLPTGAHYKLRSILKKKNIHYRDALCGGDGSGGMTAAVLRFNLKSRVIFNSILDFDGSTMKGASPDPPSALETVTNGRIRCVNAESCWENPSDLSEQRTWDYFKFLKIQHGLKIDLVVLDMEVRDFKISASIEKCIRHNISSLLEDEGVLIYKTYGSTIASEESNAVVNIGVLFETVELLQTEYSSTSTSEVYMYCKKIKKFVDSPYPDWTSLDYYWSRLFCFRSYKEEFFRSYEVSKKESLKGIPASFIPDPLVNLETLLQIAGVPSGISHQLAIDIKELQLTQITAAMVLCGMISNYTLDVTKKRDSYNPPSDGRLIRMSSALVGISFWVSVKYYDKELNNTLENILTRSFPIRWIISKNYLSWTTKKGFKNAKDVRLSGSMANIGNWIRCMELLHLPPGSLSRDEVSSVCGKYIRTLKHSVLIHQTGIVDLWKSRVANDDRSLMEVKTDFIESEHWVD
uniref:RNA-directed RNA polymerase L n=1 Tax=Chandipura virus TaxID=11272 RepID=A0A7H1HCA5_9RHAB|nr:RNA-dependent RNA polymerase [Chandipura virus]